MEQAEECNFTLPEDYGPASHCSSVNGNNNNGESADDDHQPLEGPFVDNNDIINMETQDPEGPLGDDGRQETTETENESDKENNDDDSPQRKRSRKRSLSQKDNNAGTARTARTKRRISFDASDTDISAADDSAERKKRGRSRKSSDSGDKINKKIKGKLLL